MQISVQSELSAGAGGIVNGIMRTISVDWKDESPKMTSLGKAGEPPLVGVVLGVSQSTRPSRPEYTLEMT